MPCPARRVNTGRNLRLAKSHYADMVSQAKLFPPLLTFNLLLTAERGRKTPSLPAD